jgi:hypothetical protein
VTSQPGAVQRLIELGFSQYEAQAYVGLLGREPLTGYALSNVTGIPQPKVYETLRLAGASCATCCTSASRSWNSATAAWGRQRGRSA